MLRIAPPLNNVLDIRATSFLPTGFGDTTLVFPWMLWVAYQTCRPFVVCAHEAVRRMWTARRAGRPHRRAVPGNPPERWSERTARVQLLNRDRETDMHEIVGIAQFHAPQVFYPSEAVVQGIGVEGQQSGR